MSTDSTLAKFRFRIRTRDGLELANLMIHGVDQAHAEQKLRRMYPTCEILEGEVCDFTHLMRHVLSLRDKVDQRLAN